MSRPQLEVSGVAGTLGHEDSDRGAPGSTVSAYICISKHHLHTSCYAVVVVIFA